MTKPLYTSALSLPLAPCPPSSEDEAADEGETDKQNNAADLTSDSDPDSQRSDHEPHSQQGVILPVRHDGSQSTHTPSRPG